MLFEILKYKTLRRDQKSYIIFSIVVYFYTMTLRSRDAGTIRRWDAETLGRRDAGTPRHWDAKRWDAETMGRRDAGTLGRREAGTPRRRETETLELCLHFNYYII